MKKDHRNEFRGSTNGGGEVWVGLKWLENGEIRRPTVSVVAAFAGPIWARPRRLAVKFHGDDRLVVALLPGRHM